MMPHRIKDTQHTQAYIMQYKYMCTHWLVRTHAHTRKLAQTVSLMYSEEIVLSVRRRLDPGVSDS